MSLIGLQNIHYTIGGLNLFDGVSLQIEEGDRLCILGRNGAGKSTLLKLMEAQLSPDTGEISRKVGLVLGSLDQEVPMDFRGTVLEAVLTGVPHPSEEDEGWQRDLEARKILGELGLEPDTDFGVLSGGARRRVFLARALAVHPELLILDEPTNHLDIATIQWLENWILLKNLTTVFVTHDRAFARKLANRMAEVDRGQVYAFTCGYDDFLNRREELLEQERTRMALFAKKLAQEEAWLRRGVKARLSRNEGRVKALLKMRQAWSDRRERQGSVKMTLQSAERSGDLVCEAVGLGFSYGDKVMVRNLDLTIQRGDKIGVIGPNGAGKTTLLKLLLGELSPSQGQLRLGTRLEPLYFDQLRQQLDPTKTVWENVGGGYDTVEIDGKPQHVLGYLEKFLFPADRSRVPVSILSGGERNRLLLAKLFTRPSNILILDEPTNDLDSDTLDLLEDLLVEYPGTLLLVSHDRDFLDNVVTSTLFLDGSGAVIETAGGWKDWDERKKRMDAEKAKEQAAAKTAEPAPAAKPKTKKLSFKEEKELAALPDRIAALEKEQAQIHETMAAPDFYRTRAAEAGPLNERLKTLESELEAAYARWDELENLIRP